MSSSILEMALLLFVPADRPDRFAKAFASGADAVILDLEDAVATDAKERARQSLLSEFGSLSAAPCPVVIRINPPGSSAHKADLELVLDLPATVVMVPKVESAHVVQAVTAAIGLPVIALIESAHGLAAAREIAEASARLAFGSIDFAADLGCSHSREALLLARSELVVASRLAGRPGPIDGVTLETKDLEPVRDEAHYAASLGFTGKMLIHPAHVGPARTGFAPTSDEISWAKRVLGAATDGATAVDGAMVDRPVRLHAESILTRAKKGAY